MESGSESRVIFLFWQLGFHNYGSFGQKTPKRPKKDPNFSSRVLILRILKVSVVHRTWFWGFDTALMAIGSRWPVGKISRAFSRHEQWIHSRWGIKSWGPMRPNWLRRRGAGVTVVDRRGGERYPQAANQVFIHWKIDMEQCFQNLERVPMGGPHQWKQNPRKLESFCRAL